MNGGFDVRSDGTKTLPALGGSAKNYLNKEEDLVALKSHGDDDYL
jgi:hypothetical protein